jgi:hypothetical protein
LTLSAAQVVGAPFPQQQASTGCSSGQNIARARTGLSRANAAIKSGQFQLAASTLLSSLRTLGEHYDAHAPIDDDTIFDEGAAMIAVRRKDFQQAATLRRKVLMERLRIAEQFCR